MRVLIVGAGVGGLGASAALAQHGHDVDTVEISADGSVYGVGINQPANSLRALRTIGVLDECIAAGYQYDRTRFCDFEGRLTVDVIAPQDPDVPANNALSRTALQQILSGAVVRAGVRVRYAMSVADFAQDAKGIDVTFTDGTEGRYDLVLAFDGIKSPMRRRLFGAAADPIFTGYSVWRLTVPRTADVTCSTLFQGPGTKAGVIPLSQDSMYLLHVTPEPGNPRHDPDHFDTLLRKRLDGFGGLPGELRDAIDSPTGIVYSPLSEVFLPLPWFERRVGVLGDGAHACTPHLTQGAAMALEDGVVLAEMLDSPAPLEQTLEAFQQRRFPRVQFVQNASRAILEAEMQVNASNLAEVATQTRAHLPERMAAVFSFLGQPA
jgi:2-polyprenyl-6-methoxyphenol hydroxylase-like FAD-dependent oxidoreductase